MPPNTTSPYTKKRLLITRVFSYTQSLEPNLLDAFCTLQKGFTDQFVYYATSRPVRYLGLGRCIAVESVGSVEAELQGPSIVAPVMFSFKRFDEANPKPADDMFSAFPNLRFMLPEIVLLENEEGSFLQVNSLGPVYEGRVARFARQAAASPARSMRHIPYTLEMDSRVAWDARVQASLEAIDAERVEKVVPCRRVKITASEPFSSKDLLVNLIDGSAEGTVFLYRYGDVFFCGCTPELLVRKQGSAVESMCLAGTCGIGTTEDETQRLARQLQADEKNLREHAFVVDFVRQVFSRNCHAVHIPETPDVLRLATVQHLYTPAHAQLMEGRSVQNLAGQLHPTPALSGTPVGEALMLLREIEPFNRGFFGGSVGVVDTSGNGEFSVGIRSGVFDGEAGWLYAGCGIVYGSDAASEYDEVDLKLQTILSAFN